jgi:hypothetical protein
VQFPSDLSGVAKFPAAAEGGQVLFNHELRGLHELPFAILETTAMTFCETPITIEGSSFVALFSRISRCRLRRLTSPGKE